jgi:ABC-type sugar transport system substrate-binding protein
MKAQLPFLAIALSACDSADFAPPPAELANGPTAGADRPWDVRSGTPARERPKTDASAPDAISGGPRPGIRGIELVLARPATTDRDYLIQVLRKEAGKRKLSFRVSTPEPGEAKMALAIKKGAENGYGLIVEPRGDAEFCEAVRSFRQSGLGLVLLDDPISCSDGPWQDYRIRFVGFKEQGSAIVQATIDDAAASGFPTDGTVALLQNQTTDVYSGQRTSSLIEALRGRKRPFDAVPFDGSRSDAHTQLMAYLNSHPKTSIVLADDHTGLLGGFKAHGELIEKGLRAFVLGGYALSDVRKGFPGHVACVGFAYQDLDQYCRKAADLVWGASTGKTMPGAVDVPLIFVRTQAATSQPPGVAKSAQ